MANLLGVPDKASYSPPNTFKSWQYLLIVFVLLLGVVYALPNVYQPDPSIQVRSEGETPLEANFASKLSERFSAISLSVKAIDIDDGEQEILFRFLNDQDQLRAQSVIDEYIAEEQLDYLSSLNRASTAPGWLQDIGGRPMSLGLDLSGGVHFLLQVDMDQYLSGFIKNAAEGMRDSLIQERVRFIPGRNWVSDNSIVIKFREESDKEAAAEILEEFEDFDLFDRDVDGIPTLKYSLKDNRVSELEDRAISQNLTSLRNRVNELGVSEPQVQRLGRSRIVVDLPGLQDSAKAKRILNKFANLDFRLASLPNSRRSQIESYPYEGREVEILRRSIVTGDNVQDAQQSYDPQTSQPQVNIQLDNDGGRKMSEATGPNIGRSMAILFIEQKPKIEKKVVDGELIDVRSTVEERRLISVATIQAALGFNFRITGLGLREAQDLALLLRAGALAAPMYIVEERTVGAQLGDENVERGFISVVIGFVIVLIFMLFYYRLFGFAANVALTANLILIVAIMSVLGATLTVPGIAGIVLTVGMAVDANVLIFSRIREELKEKSPQQAIQSGFDRALLTITDANVTTFFVAIILLSIGSGPVRGFAITLAVGIVCSMFTAIMVTRAQVNLIYGGKSLESLRV
ncbi:protein translocase subunit SecD [Gammaproteobacteria bacterium]|nr:protein translocase subunit SecD [Gammaproteobacteria bacterium]